MLCRYCEGEGLPVAVPSPAESLRFAIQCQSCKAQGAEAQSVIEAWECWAEIMRPDEVPEVPDQSSGNIIGAGTACPERGAVIAVPLNEEAWVKLRIACDRDGYCPVKVLELAAWNAGNYGIESVCHVVGLHLRGDTQGVSEHGRGG